MITQMLNTEQAQPEGSAISYFMIAIEDTGETYRCSSQRSVLEAMEAVGRKGIPVGCRGGGCGACKIQIVSGTYEKRVMSREHISEEDEIGHRVLACRIRPTSDITLRVLGLMKKAITRDQKSRARQGNTTTETRS
jgi:ferredoxin